MEGSIYSVIWPFIRQRMWRRACTPQEQRWGPRGSKLHSNSSSRKEACMAKAEWTRRIVGDRWREEGRPDHRALRAKVSILDFTESTVGCHQEGFKLGSDLVLWTFSDRIGCYGRLIQGARCDGGQLWGNGWCPHERWWLRPGWWQWEWKGESFPRSNFF